ncbi:MAG: MiaB/RimO family radical SAM methylthiotransferase, partial [Gemmatimonadota bacterium]
LPEIIDRARRHDDGRLAFVDFNPAENYEDLEIRRRSEVSAWVPIQRGCNYRCTYCIVPLTRGEEKNRNPEKILAEVRALAGEGITEVVLLGQTVNSYRHGEWDFPRLLRAVARVPGIRRVRFTSPHPHDFTAELVDVIAEEDAVCPHVHLPVQSGSDAVLRRMLRRYTREHYLGLVAMLRARVPEVALSTDLIVGFPGETNEDFEATLSLVHEVEYDDAFTFRFSPREGTPATRMPDEWAVADEVAQERLQRLIAEVRSISARRNASEVGVQREVLVEKRAKRGDLLQSRTPQNKIVLLDGPESWLGTYATVVLTGTTGATFTGFRVA